jgi:hypothetical protein
MHAQDRRAGDHVMAISGLSLASSHASSQHTAQSSAHHKHGGHHSVSLSDIDAAGSSVASQPSPTGKTGSAIDVTA